MNWFDNSNHTTKEISVVVSYGPAELVEADCWNLTDRSLTFRKNNQVVKCYNNHGGWLSWDVIK